MPPHVNLAHLQNVAFDCLLNNGLLGYNSAGVGLLAIYTEEVLHSLERLLSLQWMAVENALEKVCTAGRLQLMGLPHQPKTLIVFVPIEAWASISLRSFSTQPLFEPGFY